MSSSFYTFKFEKNPPKGCSGGRSVAEKSFAYALSADSALKIFHPRISARSISLSNTSSLHELPTAV